MNIRWTVGRKLAGFGVIGLVSVAAVGLTGYSSLGTLAAANADASTISAVLRNHLESDMMHDALRADVLAVQLAEGESELAAVATDVDEHATVFRANVAENEELVESPELRAAAAEIAPRLASYIDSATALVALAADGPEQVREEMPAFTAAFEDLEAAMAEFSDQIEGEQVATEAAAQSAASDARRMVVLLSLGALVAVSIAARAIAGRITRPIHRCMEGLDALAAGDLSRTVVVTGTDEVADMTTALNGSVAELRRTVEAITGNAAALVTSSSGLSTVSNQLGTLSEEASDRAVTASAAAEQVSASVHTVATASEEMGASIREISSAVADAARVAADAVAMAARTNETVSHLGDSSAEISEVVKVITSIAEQTNLLALNATIEAARAGEAGKGFAVVANEVKELAKETTEATERIGHRVAAIQTDARQTVDAIAEISEVIARIDEIQSTIAAAVVEQSAVTDEITRSVHEAAGGATEIASNLTTVSGTARETANSASTTLAAAADLADIADALTAQMSRFDVDGRSVQVVPA